MYSHEYRNLTELLLNVVRTRPALYLGRNHISKLQNFILGYELRDAIASCNPDFYFGAKGFLQWYQDKYSPRWMSFWHDYFLDAASGDEAAALDLYFQRLEEYYSWYKDQLACSGSSDG